jgi:hypothetical protein
MPLVSISNAHRKPDRQREFRCPPSQRGNALNLGPDMASLSTGSVNFPTIVYENRSSLMEDLAGRMRQFGVKPEIEIFDLSHLHGARRLADQALIDERPHVQFVMGVRNALPAEERLLDLLLGEARRLFPACTWTAAAIGRNQAPVMEWALARGADAVRTGLEDNIRVTEERLASSNAELVSLAAEAICRHGHRVATADEARTILGLSRIDKDQLPGRRACPAPLPATRCRVAGGWPPRSFPGGQADLIYGGQISHDLESMLRFDEPADAIPRLRNHDFWRL